MNIRKAKVKEIPQIAKLGIELIKYHQKIDPFYEPAKNIEEVYNNYFRKCMYSPKSLLLVAEKDGKIIGYALSSVILRPPVFKIREMGYIDDVFVEGEHRRCRIGRELLAELFEWFRRKKIKNIELNVHTKNVVGKKAWEKYGFKEYCVKLRTVKRPILHKPPQKLPGC